jgi:hypothetical protein
MLTVDVSRKTDLLIASGSQRPHIGRNLVTNEYSDFDRSTDVSRSRHAHV